jgi:predicted RNA-binding Zn-ribbon protein involved in translation (DUF1610 family)
MHGLYTNSLHNCPACGATWIGDEIPPDIRHHYGVASHFRRSIGIYDMELDMTIAIACPDCGAMFDRWTGTRLNSAPYANKMN